MPSIKDYLNYFETEANASTKIDHTIGSDKKGFFYIEWEELLASLSSGIQIADDGGNTIMYAIVPNYGYTPNTSNHAKDMEAGFIILQKVADINDMPKVATALDNTEKIVDEINLRIIRNSIAGHALFSSELDGGAFRISPLLRQHDNYYGFICQFEMQSFMGTCIDGNNWSDLPNETINALEE